MLKYLVRAPRRYLKNSAVLADIKAPFYTHSQVEESGRQKFSCVLAERSHGSASDKNDTVVSVHKIHSVASSMAFKKNIALNQVF